MYDWTAPLPPCDWCQEDSDEEVPWEDREDYWGHTECWPAWRSYSDQCEAVLREVQAGRGEWVLVPAHTLN